MFRYSKRMLTVARLFSRTVPLKSISITVNPLSVRTMSDDSKTKSDDEWRAILSPEQV